MTIAFERLKAHGHFLRNSILALIITAPLLLTLAVRGVGWDGDSIVNIAQFEKLIHPALFSVPDAGTLPKLMPILLYGGFHWLTGSYAIHWVTIALSAYAIAALVRLPAENGGGWIWLASPFVSAPWINAILSADNPALAIAFLILGFVDLMEKKPNRAIIFFLLVEFSRPGGSLLILTLILVASIPLFQRICGRLNPIFAIFALFLGVCHTALSYRLAYADFADFTAQTINYPESASFYEPASTRYDPSVIFLFAKFVIYGFPSVLPVWAILLGILGWGLHFRRKFVANNVFWPAYFCPIAILPVVAFLLGLTSSDFLSSIYLLSAVVPFLAGAVFFFGNFWAQANSPGYIFIICAIALGLAVKDGKILKDDFDTNPPKFSGRIKWLSDSHAQTLVRNARELSDRPLVLLTSCDVITLIVDMSSYVGTFVIFSDTSVDNKSYRYFRDCTDLAYKRRSQDVLLSELPNPVATIKPDIIYTTEDKVDRLDLTSQYAGYHLRGGRIIFVNKWLISQE